MAEKLGHLTARQEELLGNLVEETGEVQMEIGKIIRFGPSNHPSDSSLRNLQRLAVEVGQLQHVISELQREGVLDRGWVAKGVEQKAKGMARWSVTKPDIG